MTYTLKQIFETKGTRRGHGRIQVLRYTLYFGNMVRADDGRYVKYEDYQDLLNKYLELRQLNL